MNSVLVLSNEAATSIQQGNYKEAVGLLEKSLKQLAFSLRRQKDRLDANTIESTVTIDFTPNPQDAILIDGKDFSTSPPRASKTTIFCRDPICMSVFSVSTGNDFLESLLLQDSEKISAVVLYNLALAWHLSAITSSHLEDSVRTARLQRAIEFYEHAYCVMGQDYTCHDPFHYMALICNMGNIRHCLGHFAKAEQCFQALLSCVLCSVVSGTYDSQKATQLQGFMSNVMALILKDALSAPAA